MRAIDNADNQDLDALPLNVDITPPTIAGTLAGQLGKNNFYISPVRAEVSVSDATSGIARTEYQLDGRAWQVYTGPLTIKDGTHRLQFSTKDMAGLRSYTQVFAFKVDTLGPHIKLPSRWYIWEKGDLFVRDEGSGIASVSYEIRDSQGRWKKVEKNWSPDRAFFANSIAWNRVFADGVRAPIGNYPVRVSAIDYAGNSSQKTARIIIPPVGATPLPTFTPTPTQTPLFTATPTLHAEAIAEPSITPTPFFFITPTPTKKSGGVFSFGTPPEDTKKKGQDPNLLLGITAAALTGAYLATQRKKAPFIFGSAPKEEKGPSVSSGNILLGAKAVALVSAFTAKIEEERQRRIAEKARKAAEVKRLNILNYQAVQERIRQIARAREEARRKREEAKRKKAARHPLQDLWDRNGAAIYTANQKFKEKHGRNMNARERRKAIKNATVNGTFYAGAYAVNLEVAEKERRARAARIQSAIAEIEAEKKIGYVDPEVLKAREERAKKEKQAQQQSLANWKEADMAETSAAVIVQEETVEKKPWWKKTFETVKEKTQKVVRNITHAVSGILHPRPNVSPYKMVSLSTLGGGPNPFADDTPPSLWDKVKKWATAKKTQLSNWWDSLWKSKPAPATPTPTPTLPPPIPTTIPPIANPIPTPLPVPIIPNNNAIDYDIFTPTETTMWISDNMATLGKVAQDHNIPPELLASMIACEIDFDTDRIDIEENQKIRQDGSGIRGLTPRLGRSLGIGQVRYSTWAVATNYYLQQGYNTPTIYQGLLDKLNTGEGQRVFEALVIGNLINNNLSDIKPAEFGAEAYLNQIDHTNGVEATAMVARLLAEYRMGNSSKPSSDLSTLDSSDIAIIYTAYRAGINGLTCNGGSCGFPSIEEYQNWSKNPEDANYGWGDNPKKAFAYAEYFNEVFP